MDERSERLKEIFCESNLRSVTAFAKFCGMNQKTMDNYLKGLFKPTIDKLEMVLSAFPRYNREWLIFGSGPKYNELIGDHYENPFEEEKKEPDPQPLGDGALVDELRRNKERLLARTLRRLNYVMKLDSIVAIKDEIQGLILDLEDERK